MFFFLFFFYTIVGKERKQTSLTFVWWLVFMTQLLTFLIIYTQPPCCTTLKVPKGASRGHAEGTREHRTGSGTRGMVYVWKRQPRLGGRHATEVIRYLDVMFNKLPLLLLLLFPALLSLLLSSSVRPPHLLRWLIWHIWTQEAKTGKRSTRRKENCARHLKPGYV